MRFILDGISCRSSLVVGHLTVILWSWAKKSVIEKSSGVQFGWSSSTGFQQHTLYFIHSESLTDYPKLKPDVFFFSFMPSCNLNPRTIFSAHVTCVDEKVRLSSLVCVAPTIATSDPRTCPMPTWEIWRYVLHQSIFERNELRYSPLRYQTYIRHTAIIVNSLCQFKSLRGNIMMLWALELLKARQHSNCRISHDFFLSAAFHFSCTSKSGSI